jgi:hypothetical protein
MNPFVFARNANLNSRPVAPEAKLEAIGRHVPASRNSILKRLELDLLSIKISTIAIDF